MSDENKDRAAELYEVLDNTVRELATLEIVSEGLVTDWMVVVAAQTFDRDGNVLDTVDPLLPNRGRATPRYRTFGMLKDLLTQYEAAAGHLTVMQMHQHLESGDDEDE